MRKQGSLFHPILVIGLTAAGTDSLPVSLLERITQADLLLGGKRHLSYFPDFRGETFAIGGDIDAVAERLKQAQATGERAVILASGDPLCYGIAASLRRYFPPEALEIIPAPTAFQLAFAALAEPWHDAALLSAHARPMADVVAAAQFAPKAAILTDHQHTPAALAQALLNAGFPLDTPCAICENLGNPQARLIRTVLGQVNQIEHDPLNVFVVWQQAAMNNEQPVLSPAATFQPSTPPPLHPSNPPTSQPPNPPSLHPSPPGLPDSSFSTVANQITKREIRLLTLAELALQPGEILWDIGAGSGAVSIEAARAVPEATVYAIEKRVEMLRHAQENLRRFPASNLQLVQGIAPGDLHLNDGQPWPDPDAVFIGGSGGQLDVIIQAVQLRLRPGGRLVINLATVENLAIIRRLLPAAQVNQVQISRGVPILDMLRFEALNPVFMVKWS